MTDMAPITHDDVLRAVEQMRRSGRGRSSHDVADGLDQIGAVMRSTLEAMREDLIDAGLGGDVDALLAQLDRLAEISNGFKGR